MAAAGHQQFSLKWNNYSHHIVTALEELRVDDELTDVTLSCDGQRIKAHKVLLSACSVYFKETFKENPCKHPIVILKGVSFQDLQAVVQFMYNGQVNVTQERLPSFLHTAELLQIKGLTDSANEKEEIQVPAKKRSQTFPTQTSTALDSIRQDTEARPPTPKRKRVIGNNNSGTFSAQNSELPTQSVISSSGNGAGGGNAANNNNNPPPLIAHSAENSRDGLPIVKYEEQDADEEFDRNEENSNSFHDGSEKDGVGGETSSLGSHIRSSSSASGAVERRPRYSFQPSSNDLSATGVVDATNVNGRVNGSSPRDLIIDATITPRYSGMTNGHISSSLPTGGSKLRNRLNSRSLSSSGPIQQQDDRVIKYAPLQTTHGNGHDSRSNSSHEGGGEGQYRLEDGGSDSPNNGTDDDEEYALHQQQQQQQQRGQVLPLQLNQRRSSSNSSAQSFPTQKSRLLPHLMKGNNGILSQHNQNQQQPPPPPVQMSYHRTLTNGGSSRGSSRASGGGGVVEDLSITVSSPAHDMTTTPSFSLTQQLLQQNVLSLISSNGPAGTEVIKNGASSRASAITTAGSSSSGTGSGSSSSNSNGGMSSSQEHMPGIVAPYVCDVCGKRYVHHRSLNDHKKSHTGATKCPVCNKSFSKVANMRAHYAAQHGNLPNSTNSNTNSNSQNDNGGAGAAASAAGPESQNNGNNTNSNSQQQSGRLSLKQNA